MIAKNAMGAILTCEETCLVPHSLMFLTEPGPHRRVGNRGSVALDLRQGYHLDQKFPEVRSSSTLFSPSLTFAPTTPGLYCQSCLARHSRKACARFVGLRSARRGQRYEMRSLSRGLATASPRATNKSAPRPPGWCFPTALRADETTMAARNPGGEQSTAPSRA